MQSSPNNHKNYIIYCSTTILTECQPLYGLCNKERQHYHQRSTDTTQHNTGHDDTTFLEKLRHNN